MNSLFTTMDERAVMVFSVILLLKITTLIGLVLIVNKFLSKRSAALRHLVLAGGLFLIPLVAFLHCAVPIWSISVATLAAESIAIEESVDQPKSNNAETPATSNWQRPNTDSDLADQTPIRQEDNTASENIDFHLVAPTTTKPTEQANCPEQLADTPWFTTATISQFLAGLWALVAGLLLANLLWAWTIVSLRVHAASPVTLDELAEANSIHSDMQDKIRDRRVSIRISDNDKQMPLGFGLFRNTILLPSGCRQWSQSQWHAVLLHELAHFERGDVWVNLFSRIQQGLFWFHPLLNRLVTNLRCESELACDDRVLRSGFSQTEYAEALLSVASNSTVDRFAVVCSVTMSDTVSDTELESRMRSILSRQVTRHPVGWRTMLVVCVSILLAMVPLASARVLEVPANQEFQEEAGTPTTAAGTDEFADADATYFNISLKAGEGDTTYGGEYIVSSSAELTFQSIDDQQFTISFDELDAVVANDRRTDIIRTDGTIEFGKFLDDEFEVAIQEVLHRSPDSGAQMGRSIKTSQIYSIRRIRHAELRAGEITHGAASSKLTYHLRAPKDYDPEKSYRGLVVLHDNNSSSLTYIQQIVDSHPELAERYVLIGLNGEIVSGRLAAIEESRYRYTGLSYVGTGMNFKGFQGTDRESPAPIADAISELRGSLNLGQTFLVGYGMDNYTAGGCNAVHIHTYFPQVVDGVVVLAGASLLQCNPYEVADKNLKIAQQNTPIAICDSASPARRKFSHWMYVKYLDNNFPMLKYLESEAGTSWSSLRLEEAVEWLEAMNELQPERAMKLAEQYFDQGQTRDAVAIMHQLNRQQPQHSMNDSLAYQKIDEAITKACVVAEQFQKDLQNNRPVDEWLADFLRFRETYEFAEPASELFQQFNALAEEQHAEAKEMFQRAQKLNRDNGGDSDEAWQLYQKITTDCFASRYRKRAQSILDHRK